jgi:hypothetical protein
VSAAIGYRDGGMGADGIALMGLNVASRYGEVLVCEGTVGACVGLGWEGFVELEETTSGVVPFALLGPLSCCWAAAAAAAASCKRRR